MIKIKRVYDPSASTDGYRVLIDRLWPRGLTKEAADISEWAKDIAPSPALREAFHGGLLNWDKFKEAYKKELDNNPAADTFKKELKNKQDITLVYASKDTLHNHALILKSFLESKKT